MMAWLYDELLLGHKEELEGWDLTEHAWARSAK